MKTLAFTGHRNLYGKDLLVEEALRRLIRSSLNKDYRTFYTGMAIGVDQIAGKILVEEKQFRDDINLVAAVPFIGQTKKSWTDRHVNNWVNIAQNSDTIYVVSEKRVYSLDELLDAEDAAVYNHDRSVVGWLHARNHYMVDQSDTLLAVFDGNPKGGTYNCVEYARKKNKHIIIYNPITKKLSSENV